VIAQLAFGVVWTVTCPVPPRETGDRTLVNVRPLAVADAVEFADPPGGRSTVPASVVPLTPQALVTKKSAAAKRTGEA